MTDTKKISPKSPRAKRFAHQPAETGTPEAGSTPEHDGILHQVFQTRCRREVDQGRRTQGTGEESLCPRSPRARPGNWSCIRPSRNRSAAEGRDGPGDAAELVAITRADLDACTGLAARLVTVHAFGLDLIGRGLAVAEGEQQ